MASIFHKFSIHHLLSKDNSKTFEEVLEENFPKSLLLETYVSKITKELQKHGFTKKKIPYLVFVLSGMKFVFIYTKNSVNTLKPNLLIFPD